MTNQPISIAIAGCAGRMGKELIRAIGAQDDLSLAAGYDPFLPAGTDLGAQAGLAPVRVLAAATDQELDIADVIIDFSTATAALLRAERLAERGQGPALIIGATGFDGADGRRLDAAARAIALLQAGNMSLGANFLCYLAEIAARHLGADWDIEILESHHRHKRDAPSGTALMLGEAAAAGRGGTLADLRLPAHAGLTGPRKQGGIGFASLRGGGVIGDHAIEFASLRERVILRHVADDRSLFADGALAAARWIHGRKPGRYHMRDMFGR